MTWFRKLLACLFCRKKPQGNLEQLSPEQKAAVLAQAKILASQGVSVRELKPGEERGPEMEVGKDPL